MSTASPPSATARSAPPRFLDQVRQAALEHFHRPDAAQRCVDWATRFILFHNKRHPAEMGGPEIGQFLQQVAHANGSVVDQLQNALEMLTFVYQHVLHRDFGPVSLPQPPRLLDRLRQALRVRHYSPRTEDCYVDWAARFIRFHALRHPQEMGALEVSAFLTNLAVASHVVASTQNQALRICSKRRRLKPAATGNAAIFVAAGFSLRLLEQTLNALVFLYTQVLGLELGNLDAVRARRPKYLPVVLAPENVKRVLDAVEGGEGTFGLMCGLLYGAGLRRAECCALRVHDLDLARGQITVRHGKGAKDRVVMLPRKLRPDLTRQLDGRR
jgi:integrase